METMVSNRISVPRERGHRELWIVGLLVLPLVVAGFVLAGMGVLVDPPPVSAPPPGTPASPAATPAPAAVLPAHERSLPLFIVA